MVWGGKVGVEGFDEVEVLYGLSVCVYFCLCVCLSLVRDSVFIS